MLTDSQAEFLTHVAKCLGRAEPLKKQPERKEVGPPVFWREQEHYYDKTLDLFKTNLENLTGRVFVAKTREEAYGQLKAWLKELNAKSMMCWDHPELIEVAKPDSLDLDVYYWNGEKDRETLLKTTEKVDVGLTWVDYAIGYTGTMAVLATPTQGRVVSLLPPTHIAIFPRSKLVPTMSFVIKDLEGQKGTTSMPSKIGFITGPSRTSDIEMDLSIGVHGPYRTWAIILDEDEGKKH